MKSSADIRIENKKLIYRLMLDGNQYTKQQVSKGTGLSVATCNTLLNDLQTQKIVSGGRKLAGEVGRSSVLYQINEEHESYLLLVVSVEKGSKLFEITVVSPLQTVLFREKAAYEAVDYEMIEKAVESILGKYTNISQIIIGVPGITEQGIIKQCDIPELEDVPLKSRLEDIFHIPVSMENDMHHMAYGYCKKTNTENEVVTLACYPSRVLPGTVTIHNGMIISGANGIAGLIGFLPYNMSREKLLEALEPEKCVPFIAQSIGVIITLLNPNTIVFTGDLIEESVLEQVKIICRKSIPAEYMPQFLFVNSFDEYHREGMYQLAVDKKEL